MDQQEYDYLTAYRLGSWVRQVIFVPEENTADASSVLWGQR